MSFIDAIARLPIPRPNPGRPIPGRGGGGIRGRARGYDLGSTLSDAVSAIGGDLSNLGGGKWMGQSSYGATPYAVDPNAFVDRNAASNKAAEGMIRGRAENYRAPTVNAVNAAAPQQVTAAGPQAATIDTGQAAQSRAQQQGLIAALQARVAGRAPSVAQAQLNQATAANQANAMALAASQRDAGAGGAGLAMRNALTAGAQANQTAAGQAATLRAQEQTAAEQNLGATVAGQQAQDIGLATGQAGLEQQARMQTAAQALAAQQSNQAAGLQVSLADQAAQMQAQEATGQMSLQNQQILDQTQLQSMAQTLGIDANTLQAQIEQQQMMSGNYNAAMGLNQNTAAINAAQQGNAIGGILSGGAAGAAAALLKRGGGGPVPTREAMIRAMAARMGAAPQRLAIGGAALPRSTINPLAPIAPQASLPVPSGRGASGFNAGIASAVAQYMRQSKPTILSADPGAGRPGSGWSPALGTPTPIPDVAAPTGFVPGGPAAGTGYAKGGDVARDEWMYGAEGMLNPRDPYERRFPTLDAEGGRIPMTSTAVPGKDSVLADLTPGEQVTALPAVKYFDRHLGEGFLAKLNEIGKLGSALEQHHGIAIPPEGLVAMMSRAMASAPRRKAAA